jgi:hypothetical protein|nr:MAG TPA: hypothetical protein [Caudoviricetes sp.]
MLQSKYFTEEGLKVLLSDFYEGGARYMYRPTGYALIYLSRTEPSILDDGEIESLGDEAQALPMHTVNLLSDIFENTNCINIANALNKVDWSKVPVNTKVYAYCSGTVQQRHFARYEGGTVHTWVNGGTSWSTTHTNDGWDRVELAEEI